MNLLDLALVAILALGLYLGFRRGLIRPLISQVGSILVLVILVRDPSLLDHVVPASVPRFLAVGLILLLTGIVVGLVARIVARALYAVPLVAPLDKVAGVAFNAVFTFVILYLLLSALVTLDGVLQPIHRFAQLGPAQIAQLQQNLARYPGAALFIDRNKVQSLQAAGTVPVANLGQYDAWLGFYENSVRPQLVGSTLGPLLLRLGEKLPIVGHHQSYPKPEARDKPAS